MRERRRVPGPDSGSNKENGAIVTIGPLVQINDEETATDQIPHERN